MARQYAPHEFGATGQLDPRRWNENVEALKTREAELVAQRWSRFELTFTFDQMTNVTKAAGQAHSYKFALPFAYEIEFVHMSINSADAAENTYKAEVGNPFTLEVTTAGDSTATLLEKTQGGAQLVPASTEVEVELSSTGTTYDAGGGSIIVYCKADSMATIDGTLTALSKIELYSDDDMTAAFANALFTDHAANMAKFGNDAGASISIKTYASEVISVEPGSAAITTEQQAHKITPGLGGWYLDRVDCYSEAASGTVTFELVSSIGGSVLDSAALTSTGIGNTATGSISGLGSFNTDGDANYLTIRSSGATVYRAWAVLHFITRS